MEQGLCPASAALEPALRVRKAPLICGQDPDIPDRAGAFNRDIQRYADVLEAALRAEGICN